METKGTHVERLFRPCAVTVENDNAEDADAYPVMVNLSVPLSLNISEFTRCSLQVDIQSCASPGKSTEVETIHAKYVVAADG